MVGLILAAAMSSMVPQAQCDLACERQEAAQLIDVGQARAAVERLRNATSRFPDDLQLVLLMARAYLVEGNLYWAERTLRDAAARWPDDAQLRAWLALVHLRQGDPELVTLDLEPDLEPTDDPQRARWRLLDASRARLAGDPESAAQALDQVSQSTALYPEDRPAWALLQASGNPWWSEAISGTLEVGGGRTSNALAGSPTDVGASGEPSGLALLELRSRFTPPTGGALQPAIDLDVLGHGLTNDSYREMSTLQAGLRLGGVHAGDERRLSFGYRAEVLYLNQDSPLYSEAHRGELEVEWAVGKVVFVGAGHRTYRDERRTRWEADLGYGGPLRLSDAVPVVAGATLRLADASSPAYDQLGLSAAASALLPVAGRTALRIALTGVWDDYPNSGGVEGRRVFGTEEKRRDLLGRVAATLWLPPFGTVRPGVELRYTRRDSTADETPGFDFSFREWRAVAWLKWSFAADPWAPRVVEQADHVPLEWGLESEAGMDEERILDLLRRDEELRRGSSCGLP